jgi:hypothetical protein
MDWKGGASDWERVGVPYLSNKEETLQGYENLTIETIYLSLIDPVFM